MMNVIQVSENVPAYWQGDDVQMKPRDDTAMTVAMENVRLGRRLMQLETEVLELRQALERERHCANIDALTGIANRRAYQRRLEEERALSRREHKRLSLVVWDIDRFKSINDRYGHKVGDQVIACVARKISQRLRKSDFIARFGGEEFVALLSDCDAVGARELAEGLRKEIAACSIEIEGFRVNVTVSCGIAELAQNEDDAKLFARADEALYRAKGAGRNRVCVDGT